jgi:hypothetical protein
MRKASKSHQIFEPAIAAVKTWTVNPATFNEKKLDAKLVVAFVFRSPTISTP